ncbi:MAG: plastocyanin/azurin family copper-binding protein [Pseudomonadota bacterium]
MRAERRSLRRRIAAATVWAGMAAAAAVAATGLAVAQGTNDVHIVHQHTDNMAGIAARMFRFEPDILKIAPGETVVFLNSVRSHTVRTQQPLWPDGVDPLSIRGKARSEVTFDRPGLYGITCARHGRYGMTMLIAVGAEGLAEAAELDTAGIPASDLAKAAFARQARALLTAEQ